MESGKVEIEERGDKRGNQGSGGAQERGTKRREKEETWTWGNMGNRSRRAERQRVRDSERERQ